MRASILATAALAAVILTGCAGPVADQSTVDPKQNATVGTLDDEQEILDPSVLVGTWKVSDAKGMEPDTWLRLGEEATVSFDCGNVGGSWTARDDAFLAQWEWSEVSCDFGNDNPVPWLDEATAYAQAGDSLVLLDADGKTVATLTDDGAPPRAATDPHDPFSGEVELTDQVRATIRDGIPLPDEATPTDDLLGRWVPTDDVGPTRAFVEFGESGYMSSDGCNQSGGRWVVGSSGSLLSTNIGTTFMACDNMYSIDGLIGGAVAVGMVADELTFYGPSGSRLGAIVRE